MDLGSEGRDAFARDGVSGPAVLAEDGVLRLWYTGTRGASSSIGYAVSADGVQWQGFGAVLTATEPWEGGKVSAPAVVAVRDGETGLERLRLYYQAGPSGLEAVGLVERDVPAF